MTSAQMIEKVSLKEVVGGSYNTFWRSTKRYAACKGSRGSKKSKTTALWHIVKLMEYPLSNALVIRKTERTLRDSCFADLQWAVNRLGVEAFWKCTTSPLEMTYIPTGQKILFRGLDNPLKITSISVSHGFVNFVWIEEAYEISKESDFDTIDESIRGEMPEGYFKRLTLTFNPWNERHWLKKRFFDKPSDDVLAMTTTYECNEWLDSADKRLFEEMKIRNPRRYKVAALGEWGISEGMVYENWKESNYELKDVAGLQTFAGLDFGYTNDPSAFVLGFIDTDRKRLFVWDEFYNKGMSNRAIYETINDMGYSKERITADSAEPKSIDELRGLGLRIKGARKGKDSIRNGIQFLQDFEILIHPRCVNYLTEISSYAWDKDRFGNMTNQPADELNHLMDATRYGIEEYIKGRGWLI